MPVDPATAVGLAASASQLAGQALGVVRSLWNYGEAFKNAPKDSAELRRELGTLYDLLRSLNVAISNNTAGSASLKDSFRELESMLDEMNNRVKPWRTAGLNRMTWPFKMDENKRFLSRITRYNQAFSLALDIQIVYSNLLSYVYSPVGPTPEIF